MGKEVRSLLLILLLSACGGGDGFEGDHGRTCKKGDVNHDGSINYTDYQLISHAYNWRQGNPLEDGPCVAWDLDNDGQLTDTDVIIVYDSI